MFSEKPSLLQTLTLASTAPLSKDQKAFNTLIRKIEAHRTRLAGWNEAIPPFRHQRARDLYPLMEQERALKARLAERLDWAHGQKGVTRAERRKLSALIVELALFVLDQGAPDATLKALYNKHSQSDFDADETAQLAQVKAMLEDTLGLDLGDDLDLRSPEALFERMQTEFQAQQETRQQAPPRKPSAKQQAREAQREAEAKQLSQSIREVYRKLASALHPDREADPAEKQRKTALMQQANEAYQRGNLLELLELQLQLEHIDPSHLATLGGERLKHYIKILKDQVRELDDELQRVEHGLAAELGLPPFARLSPAGLMSQLRVDIATTQVQLRTVQAQLDDAGDVKRLKAWLKTVTLRPAPDFDSLF